MHQTSLGKATWSLWDNMGCCFAHPHRFIGIHTPCVFLKDYMTLQVVHGPYTKCSEVIEGHGVCIYIYVFILSVMVRLRFFFSMGRQPSAKPDAGSYSKSYEDYLIFHRYCSRPNPARVSAGETKKLPRWLLNYLKTLRVQVPKQEVVIPQIETQSPHCLRTWILWAKVRLPAFSKNKVRLLTTLVIHAVSSI